MFVLLRDKKESIFIINNKRFYSIINCKVRYGFLFREFFIFSGVNDVGSLLVNYKTIYRNVRKDICVRMFSTQTQKFYI